MTHLFALVAFLRALADLGQAAVEAVGVVTGLVQTFSASLAKARADLEAKTSPPANPEDSEPAQEAQP